MKQYLKQIKRHFPQLDSWVFLLIQVLHLRERWREEDRCANTFLGVLGDAESRVLFLSVLEASGVDRQTF